MGCAAAGGGEEGVAPGEAEVRVVGTVQGQLLQHGDGLVGLAAVHQDEGQVVAGRGKARRNTEAFARERGIATITAETLYDAKAHYGR